MYFDSGRCGLLHPMYLSRLRFRGSNQFLVYFHRLAERRVCFLGVRHTPDETIYGRFEFIMKQGRISYLRQCTKHQKAAQICCRNYERKKKKRKPCSSKTSE
jgi:hypothetical protein